MTSERHGRLELAIGKIIQPFGHSRDAYVLLDQVVIRRDIAVTERPIFAVAVLRSGFEIRFAETQTHTSPDVGAATRHPKAAHPVKWLVFGRCVWFLEIVDEPVIVVFAANIELGLNWTRLANNVGREVSIFQLECGLVLGEVSITLWTSCLKQGDSQPCFG